MTFVPPTQFSAEAFYSVAPEEAHWTLEHLLGIFGFDNLRCGPYDSRHSSHSHSLPRHRKHVKILEGLE